MAIGNEFHSRGAATEKVRMKYVFLWNSSPSTLYVMSGVRFEHVEPLMHSTSHTATVVANCLLTRMLLCVMPLEQLC